MLSPLITTRLRHHLMNRVNYTTKDKNHLANIIHMDLNNSRTMETLPRTLLEASVSTTSDFLRC